MSGIISATAPCSWGVWWADGTPSKTPYRTFLDQAAAAGYQSIELGPDGYLPAEESLLREELEARKLTVCAGTACCQFDQQASFETFRPEIEALCRRIKAFDAKYLVTMDESDVGLYSEKKDAFTTHQWEDFLKKIHHMAQFAEAEYGVEVLYHPHIKSMIETETEITRLMEYTGLNLCFDTGHYAYVNGDGSRDETSVIDFIRKFPERIKYLHFKNIAYDVFQKVRREHIDSDTAFDIDVMCDLADGIINYKELKSVLDEIGYEGIGVIEQDMPRATAKQAFAAAKRNLDYLRAINMVC